MGESSEQSTSSTEQLSSDAYRTAQSALIRDTWPKQVAQFPPASRSMVSAVNLMILLMLVVMLCLWYLSVARWVTAAIIMVYVSSKMFNGFDNLELTLHMNMFASAAESRGTVSADKKNS